MLESSALHKPGEDADALDRLRHATAHLHAAVDAALAGGLTRRDHLARYLRAMHGLAGWLDSASPPLVPAALSAWRDPQRAILALGDLRALGQATADDALPPPTPGEWIGGCYVMEGSALGGRLLLRQAESLQARHPEVAGALNFLRYHTRDPARWPRLLVILRALPRSSFDEAIRGAQAAFSLTHRLLAVLVPASPEIQ